MIVVQKVGDVFKRVGGNPTILSLDGTRKAPLKVILHASWSAEDRAEYGIYHAIPLNVPVGMRIVGATRFEMLDGVVREIGDFEPVPVHVAKKEMSIAEKAISDWAASLGITLDDVRRVLT